MIGPADPRAQMILCSGLRGPDALACVRGVKVQNLLDRPEALLVEVVAGCERIDAAVRAGCYRRLGKTRAVLTDGAFESSGCPRLSTRVACRVCAEGARALDGPLETFS